MELIALLLSAAFAVVILISGNIKTIAQYMPKAVNYQNREYAEKFRNNRESAQPLSDSEYEQIRKSYGNTTGAAIVIPIMTMIIALLTAGVIWSDVDTVFMVMYIVIVLISYILSIVCVVKNKKALTADRDCFAKKLAYLLSSDTADLYRIKHDHLRKSGNAYYVMIAFADDEGRQLTYKFRVSYEQYLKIIENKKCYAVLYKGIFSTVIA